MATAILVLLIVLTLQFEVESAMQVSN